MRVLHSAGALARLVCVAVLFLSCKDGLTPESIRDGDPQQMMPTNISLAAASDSTVTISWSPPEKGTPDKYEVWFEETGTSSYGLAVELTATSFEHNPNGKTGRYQVVAVFGSGAYYGTTSPTSVPIATAALDVYELNGAGNSGYGWDRTAGTGATYPMAQAGSAASADFYITDFATGLAGPYALATPDMGPSDPGGLVPSGAWRANGFSNWLPSENDPLPKPDSLPVYWNYTMIPQSPLLVAVHTSDGYYALVKVTYINAGGAFVSMESWFQLVKGLRLIQH